MKRPRHGLIRPSAAGLYGTKLDHNSSIPATMFGMHHLGAQIYQPPSVTFGPQRWWDVWGLDPVLETWGVTAWPQIHTAAGTFHWDLFDSLLSALHSRGKTGDLIYTVGYKPEWVGAPGTSDFVTRYTEFVTAVATRAAGKIKVWGLWNEPNGASPLELSETVLAAIAASAYPAIKAVDSTATVLSPEFQGNGAGNLGAFLSAGGGPYFDVLALHLYGVPDPDALATAGGTHAVVAAYKSAMATAGLSGRAIWNTEFSEDGGSAMGGSYAENERDFISQMLPLLWSLGIDRSYYYAWDATPPVGRMWADADGNTTTANKNVAGVAWDTVRGWMLGKTISAAPIISGKAHRVDLAGSGGYSGRIIWSFKSTGSHTIPAGTFKRSVNPAGTISAIGSGVTSIAIGNTPILIDTTLP